MSQTPQRIVCLSAEAADWLCRLGVWDQVVGVTAFFTQPPDAPPKPRVSGFSSGNLEEITRLSPDLIITFSDVQAAVAAELIRRGCQVIATNQRTLAETEATLALLARVVDHEAEAEAWLQKFRTQLAASEMLPEAVRVYFEEWNNPLVTGIGWVSELIERAGGCDVFAALRDQRSAANRVVQPEQVRAADPEIIFTSWCGKPLSRSAIISRPGWNQITAVRTGQIFEIPARDILQPGFRLVYGFERIKEILHSVTHTRVGLK